MPVILPAEAVGDWHGCTEGRADRHGIQNAPSFAYVIGDYTVSKTGTVSGPANEALMAALNAKGFIAE